MRYAVHQVLVNRTACRFVWSSSRCAARRVINRRFAVHDLVNQLFRLMDAVGNAGDNYRFAVKPSHFYIFICRDNNAVTFCNFLCGQRIFHAAGTIGFYLGRNAHRSACFLQVLRCHVCVRNAGRACGYTQNAVSRLRNFFLGKAFIAEILFLFLCNQIKELLRCFRRIQLCYKLFICQQAHHARQHIHVQIAVHRRCNHEKQTALVIIIFVVLNGFCQSDNRQTRRCNNICLGVRNCDSFAYICREFGFTRINCLFICFFIRDISVRELKIYQLIDDGIFVFCFDVERRCIATEQFNQLHMHPSFSYFFISQRL